MSTSDHSSPSYSVPPRRLGVVQRFLLGVLLIALSLSVPPVFRSAVWLLLQEEAWRQGGEASTGKILGSLWDPLEIHGLHLGVPCADGGRLEFNATQITVEVAWGALVERMGNRRFLEHCHVRGGRVAWNIGTGGSGIVGKPMHVRPLVLGEPLPFPIPSWLDLEFKSASITSEKFSLRAEDIGLSLSELAPGEWKAGKFEVQLKSWSKIFRDIQGKTSLQGGRLQLGETQLMEGLRISAFNAVLSEVAAGRMDFELQAEAFGGELRVLAQADSSSPETPFEASGTFSKLGVAPLAGFLNVTEAAGGILEAGKFSFRGNTAHPDRGTASLRLEAKNFQWESRQWDSLVLGATLLDRRIQVPEFVLRQGHNQLVLNGDMQWPGGDSPWWKSDFGVNISVRVENLTELSALLLPDFKYAAGGLTVDGAIRSQSGVLGGALIVSGANLTWRSAPIEELHAAIKLQGEEIQLLNVDLTQGADFLRGKGALRIGEGWSYQGDFHGKVRDLAKYASLLEPPLVSQPYAGGFDFDWSGKGNVTGQEGRVRATFQQLRPVRAQAAWAHPMSGGISGTYNKDGVEVESASLGNGEIEVSTAASFGAVGLRLSSLNVRQGQAVVLEGGALLPKEIWTAWPQLNWSGILKAVEPIELRLVSKGLNLALLGRLPGMPSAIEGTIDGDWTMKGDLKNLEGSGSLQLRQAAWALSADRLSKVGADLFWEGRSIQIRNLAWTSSSGLCEGKASLIWGVESAPQFELAVACEKAEWRAPLGLHFPIGAYREGLAVPLQPVVVRGRAEWKVSGPLSAPLLSGEVLVKEIDFGGVPDLRSLWRDVPARRLALKGIENRLLRGWKLQLNVVSGEGATVTGTTGAARVELKAAGTAGLPEWFGEVRLAVRGAAAGGVLEVVPLVLKLAPGQAVPDLEIRAHGTTPGGAVFRANAVGPLGQPVREYQVDAPLTLEQVRGVFEEGKGW